MDKQEYEALKRKLKKFDEVSDSIQQLKLIRSNDGGPLVLQRNNTRYQVSVGSQFGSELLEVIDKQIKTLEEYKETV